MLLKETLRLARPYVHLHNIAIRHISRYTYRHSLFAQFPVTQFHTYEIVNRFCLLVSFWRDNPPVGQGLLIQQVSRSHTTTHHSR